MSKSYLLHKTGTIIDYFEGLSPFKITKKKTLKKYKQVGNVINNMATQVSLSPDFIRFKLAGDLKYWAENIRFQQ